MPRDFFVDLDAGYFVAGDRDPTPVTGRALISGDLKDSRLYFLERTGIVGDPYVYADKSGVSCKLALGQPTSRPVLGVWTSKFGADTTSLLAFNVSETAYSTAFNALASATSAGGVTISGSMASGGFIVRFNIVGARDLITVDASALAPLQEVSVFRRQVGDGFKVEVQEIRFRAAPAARQDTWSDMSTSCSLNISTLTAGSSTANEVQRAVFTTRPVQGTISLIMPADTRTVSSIVDGVATTSENHCLVEDQPISFSSSSGASNYSDAVTYYVASIISPKKFTFAANPGGSSIDDAAASSATLNTIAEASAPLDFDANQTAWQEALEAMKCIGAGNATVRGKARDSMVIGFIGRKGLGNLPAITVTASNLATGPGKSGNFDLRTISSRDALRSLGSAECLLECELDGPDTVAQSPLKLSEEVISAVGFTQVPIPGSGIAAVVDIDESASDVEVTFPHTFAVPPRVVVTKVGIPSGGDYIDAIPDQSTITETGFTAILSAATPAAGYKLHYFAIQ